MIGGTNSEIEYTGDYGLYAVPQNPYELTDTVNVTLGKHVIQTGGTFLYRQVQFFRPIAGKGFYQIANDGVDFTGYEPTELLVGGVDDYQIGAQNGYFRNNSQEDAVFFQDAPDAQSRHSLGPADLALRTAQPGGSIQPHHGRCVAGRPERRVPQHH